MKDVIKRLYNIHSCGGLLDLFQELIVVCLQELIFL